MNNERIKVRTLKKSRQLFCVLLLVFIAACARMSLDTEKPAIQGPHLVIDEPVYDFVYSGPGIQVRHTFKLTNSGNDPLVISEVNSDCGCIATLLSGNEILPGETGSLQAFFETKEYEGKQKKNIVITSNDPVQGDIVLTIQGEIKRGTVLVPEAVYLGDVVQGGSSVGTVKLLQLSEEPLVVTKIDTGKFLTAQAIHFRDENSRGYEIAIRLEGDVPKGHFTSVVTLHTNAKKRPRIDVPVWANIK